MPSPIANHCILFKSGFDFDTSIAHLAAKGEVRIRYGQSDLGESLSMKDLGQFSGFETSSITGLLTTLIPSFCKIVANLSEFNVEINFGPLFIGRLSKISVSGKVDSNSDNLPW